MADGWTTILGDDEPQLRLQPEPVNEEGEARPLLHQEPALHSASMGDKITGAALFLLFASYFEVASVILSLFQPCDRGYMAAYPWQLCSGSMYWGLVAAGAGFGLLYIVGLPALFAWLLYRRRHPIAGGQSVGGGAC